MSEGLGFLESIELLAASGIRVFDNSAEELREPVTEISPALGNGAGARGSGAFC
jgi:hypothetical protein